jgi:hypothetical protein
MSEQATQRLGLNPLPNAPIQHLIVPWALSHRPEIRGALQNLPMSSTRHLQQLLRGMRICERERGSPDNLSPPHERALARLLGWQELPDGMLPWAARCAPVAGSRAWAWISLCHWVMGREQASLSDPQALHISPQESDALLQTMRPYFESEGIALHPAQPGHWLGQGEVFDQPSASLDRVIARNVDPWLPAGPKARLLRRLQNEMQMLLYTHPVNQARDERGAPLINSLWFSGSGRLPADNPPLPGVHLTRELAAAALSEDPLAYARAWAQLDASSMARLLEQQRQGHAVELTLCGERGWLRLQSLHGGPLRRLVHRLVAPGWPDLLKEDL